MRARAGPRHGDEGQISLLLVGYLMIVLLVVFTAVSATVVHLARHRLLSVADGAALDAADALDGRRFYAEVGGAGPGPDRAVSLSAASVRSSVTAYLAAAPDVEGLGGVRPVEPTGSPDGSTAEVTLETTVRLPLVSVLIGDGPLTVRVTARARARQTG